jgi:hypothetical protein
VELPFEAVTEEVGSMTTVRPRSGSLIAVLALFLFILVAPTAAAAPRQGATLAGTVRGPTGATLAGVVVTVYGQPGAQAGCPQNTELWAPVARATTTRTGTYAVTLPPGSYRIGVVPPNTATASFGYRVRTVASDGSNVTSWVGFAHDVLLPSNGLSGVDVKLSTPRVVTGTVTEETTGVPLVGVEVRAVAESGSQTQRIAPMTVTAADGTYTLAGLPRYTPDPNPSTPQNEASRYGMTYVDPSGTHQLWLWWWSGFGPPAVPNDTPVVDVTVDPTSVRDVVMRLTGRAIGVVSDARGRPLAGIAVEPMTAFPYPPRYTDAKGRYTIEGQGLLRFSDPKGVYRTTYSGGYQYAYQAVAADPSLNDGGAPGTTRVTNVVLYTASRIVGSLVYTANLPGAGAAIGAWEPGFVNDWYHTAAPGLPAACNGTFAVTGLWAGTYNITAGSMWDWEPAVVRTVAVGANTTVDIGQLVLPSWIISGQVTTPDGPGVGIVAELWGFDPNSNQFVALADIGMPWARTVTSADTWGGFRLVITSQFPNLQLRLHDPSGTWADPPPESVYDPSPWDNSGPLVFVTLTPA